MKYETVNEAKACFDDVYTAPTPHTYLKAMGRNDYEIGEQARPYCLAAVDLLKERNGDRWPVRMLDIGCSYGMGSALVKFGRSFEEIENFFSERASRDAALAPAQTKAWIKDAEEEEDLRCVGLDSSKPAIDFAIEAGLLDGGIARDFEDPENLPTDAEIARLRSCNLLVSTGAIGYITDRTMEHVVEHVGEDHPGEFGPFAVLTILRMFNPKPIVDVFEQHGFRFEKVPGVMLPQRSFADEDERQGVLKILHDKGIDTRGFEDRGKQYAELFIAARPEHFQDLMQKMVATHGEIGDE